MVSADDIAYDYAVAYPDSALWLEGESRWLSSIRPQFYVSKG